MIKRRNASAERMITAAERARFLQRQDVGWLLDHAEQIGARASEQISQIPAVVKKPHACTAARLRGGRDDLRRFVPACRSRAWTIQSAIRSAERGPTPGMPQLRDQFPDRGRILGLPQGRADRKAIGQMQRERLNPAEIELQRRVLLLVRPTRFLELRIGLAPAFFAEENDTVPERIPPRDLSGSLRPSA